MTRRRARRNNNNYYNTSRKLYFVLEEINGERIVAINLAQEVLQPNDNWDNKTVTYQEAKQEFDDFISENGQSLLTYCQIQDHL